ncbi:LysR family transcriptional regulator [Euryhalocaulis caribicus]|uniref:LysR family transcriptional regulator n=1 Tax=Euryhalocaulis caribicus TaxID=1161401 RepID=UPI0003A6C3F1|nr:LysR family transcriptional regulator [Euryhalocaulis caribicus]
MIDLNDLRIFERVAALGGFSRAAEALGMPKSSASRAVARLEEALGVRLFQRTTRQISLTSAGDILFERSRTMLAGLEDALALTADLAEAPRGALAISAGIGFGINVLADQLPGFLTRYPDVRVSIDLTSRNAELVSERIDVAIRIGALSDSSMVATRLGTLPQYLCAAPAYIDGHGRPNAPNDLAEHQAIVMPGPGGRPRPWQLTRDGRTEKLEPDALVVVNDALTISKLVLGGAGIGALSAYLCGEAILSGYLERLLPDWSLPPLPVSLLFPSGREVSPSVRAFVDYMREANRSGAAWLEDPLNGR